PISDLATRMVTVSSGSITIQAVISWADGTACTARGPNGISKPRTSEPPTAATLARNDRRGGGGAGVQSDWVAPRPVRPRRGGGGPCRARAGGRTARAYLAAPRS